MVSNINEDNKEIVQEKDGTILNLFYENQTNANKRKENLIRIENINTIKQIISNDSIFASLNNDQCLIMVRLLISDKRDSQLYIKKVLDHANDDLVLSIAKDKDIYHNLNRENKNVINSKLNKSPWITSNEIIPLDY